MQSLTEKCVRRHRETVPCPSHGRTQESRTEPTKILFEEALKIVKSEAELGRTFPTQELDFEFFLNTWSGMENPDENETRGDGTCVTPKTAIHHNTGDAVFGSRETPQWTGRVPAPSGADVTAAVYMLRRTTRHANTDSVSTNLSKLVAAVVVESTRVTGVDKLTKSAKTMLWNHRLMENDEIDDCERLG